MKPQQDLRIHRSIGQLTRIQRTLAPVAGIDVAKALVRFLAEEYRRR